MKPHILIVEDHEDIYENITNKLRNSYQDTKITVSDNCDKAFYEIKRHNDSHKVTLLILDLTFKHNTPNTALKTGKHLLKQLITTNFEIPTIIYSSHDSMDHIFPVMKNYTPQGYVIKSNTSSQELLFAVNQVFNNKTYYSQKVHQLQYNRLKYAHELDDIDTQIIELLPSINTITDWDGKVIKNNAPLSYKSIAKRTKKIMEKFDVENEKQLLLKLYKLAII